MPDPRYNRPMLRRRNFVLGAAALTVAPAAASAADLRPTGQSFLGPFFPVSHHGESDADLTQIAGHARSARGQVIEVAGRVLDRHGKPVSGARLKLWQANAGGRYEHPQDSGVVPLDPDFQGYAEIACGPDGSWRIKTVKPGAYDSPIGRRTPHIHFDVAGHQARTILQMYFPEEAASNATDLVYRTQPDAATSVATARGDWRYGWDIVLIEG